LGTLFRRKRERKENDNNGKRRVGNGIRAGDTDRIIREEGFGMWYVV